MIGVWISESLEIVWEVVFSITLVRHSSSRVQCNDHQPMTHIGYFQYRNNIFFCSSVAPRNIQIFVVFFEAKMSLLRLIIIIKNLKFLYKIVIPVIPLINIFEGFILYDRGLIKEFVCLKARNSAIFRGGSCKGDKCLNVIHWCKVNRRENLLIFLSTLNARIRVE